MIDELRRDVFERSLVDKIFRLFYRLIYADVLMRFDDVPSPSEVDWEWTWPIPTLVDAEATARTNAIRVKSAPLTPFRAMVRNGVFYAANGERTLGFRNN